jgi:hypothetical protein
MADTIGFASFPGCEFSPYADLLGELPERECTMLSTDRETLTFEVSSKINTVDLTGALRSRERSHLGTGSRDYGLNNNETSAEASGNSDAAGTCRTTLPLAFALGFEVALPW